MFSPALSPHFYRLTRLCGLSPRVPTAPLPPSLWLPSEGLFSSGCPPLTNAQPTALGNGDTQTPFSVLPLDIRALCTLRCCGLQPPVPCLSPCGAVGIKGQCESESELCHGLPADCRHEEERKRPGEETEAIQKRFSTEAGLKEPCPSFAGLSCNLDLLSKDPQQGQPMIHGVHSTVVRANQRHGCHDCGKSFA